VTAFAKDIEKFFLKKARQLDETAACLLRDPHTDGSLATTGVEPVRSLRSACAAR
jgi:hypothetical protein